MTPTRETVFAALFALVSASASFVTKSRQLEHWDDAVPESAPYLFQTQVGDGYAQQRGLPPKIALQAKLYIYVCTHAQQDSSVVASTLLNPLLDLIDDALAPDNLSEGTCTLGGLVSHCWISSIETSEGYLADWEVAIVNIEILVASS